MAAAAMRNERTGHTHEAPRTHLEALRRFDFDTVMFPLNFVLWADPAYRGRYEGSLRERVWYP